MKPLKLFQYDKKVWDDGETEMKLTRIIFDKWKIWMTLPDRTLMWALKSKENLGFYDWYIMDFWYCLNHDWYKMNNKMYAYTGCEDPYTEPRDFIDYEEYWEKQK